MRKKLFVLLAAILISCGVVNVSAQTSLAGRVYHHPNIMADGLNDAMKDSDKKLAEAKKEAVAKAEKEKGRKLTAAEQAEVDRKVMEASKMLKSMQEGLKTAVTVEFKNKKDVVMKADMKISEDVMKAAGIGWAKRKAMKLALYVAPKTQKGTYVVKNDMVIIDDGEEEKDTLRLSQDGKQLFGKFDKKTKFTLNRIK